MTEYHPIDINNWDRRDLYEHFSRLKFPHFAVAAYIDVTRLLEYKRREGLSFYLSLIYLTTKVLNGIDNFRLCHTGVTEGQARCEVTQILNEKRTI